jgi:hypothetical protein
MRRAVGGLKACKLSSGPAECTMQASLTAADQHTLDFKLALRFTVLGERN